MIKDMVEKPTVLVLGAGASAPYGFPSGEGLVTTIRRGLETGSGLFECVRQCHLYWKAFAERLRVCVSVDAFLEKQENAEFLDVGKFSIAAALLPKENEEELFEGPSTGRSWYKQLFALLTEGGSFDDFAANKLSVITFNYDRSLECYLVKVLHNFYAGKSIEGCYERLRSG